MIFSSGGRKTAAHLAAGVLLALVTVGGAARAVADDIYEENDTLATAYDFSLGHMTWLSTWGGALGVANDDDWYMISVPTASRQLDIICTFSHASGDIDMDLYDSAGFWIDSAFSVSDDEFISLSFPAAGTYYILVYPYFSSGNTYDLWWEYDDPYEPNDTLATAWDFSLGEMTWLSTYGGYLGVANDYDWYMIDVTAGYENVVIDCMFTDALGDIDIELVDSGGVLVAGSYSTTDNEYIDAIVAGPGTYYILVYPSGGTGNTYDLWWDDVDDRYEQNDTLATAWDFSMGEMQLLSTYGGALGVQLDDDWYMIDVATGYENVIIDCTFTDAAGDIDIELVDSGGVVVAGSYSFTDDEGIDFIVAGPGTYYIRVFFGNAGNTYDLEWATDDIYEPNDMLTTAWDFSMGEMQLLSTYGGSLGVQADDDWYMIDVTSGYENVVINCTFTHFLGDIDIELYDSAGVWITDSASSNDNENIDTIVAGPGTYYIRVYFGDAGNTYDLSWDDVLIPGNDDPYEENDTFATAWDFSLGETQWLSTYGGELGVQLDDDWYMITVTAGYENVMIDCTFTHADGDIDIELVDSGGAVVASSTSVTDDESIDTSVAGPGTYYIRVYYGDAGNTYDLWWDDLWSDVDLYDDGTVFAGFSPMTVSNGLSFSAYSDVRNGGTTAAGGFWVDYYASVDTVINTSDYLLGYAWVTGVAAGDFANADMPAITWPPLSNPPIGSYYVGWIIDALGDVPETDETNNTEYKPSPMLTVSAPPDDSYEENDAQATAWDFSLGERTWLSIYGGELGVQLDDDWYMIDVTAGFENVVIDCTFTHAAGDIDIDLVDSGGFLVDWSLSVTDNESIDFVVAGPGTYYIVVYGANAGNLYDLWWDDVRVPVSDDPYEPNNTQLTAWDFSGGAGTLLSTYGGAFGMQGNEDWYLINVAQGYEDVTINCTFSHAAGDIDIELYDSAGVWLTDSASFTDNESINTIVAGPGAYYILVFFANMENTYDLLWSTAANDDSYEENDTLATAWDFSLDEMTWLSVAGGEMGVQLDDDWYMIDVTAGDENVVIDCTFTNTDGDIDIDLVDSGGAVVASSASFNDNESIDFVVAGPGTYYIVVYGANAGNPYDLWWDDVSVPASDDPYEPNNSMLTAWDFSMGEDQLLSAYGGAMGVQWNDDWYMINVTAGYENVVIDCTFTHSAGDINIELVDSAGAVVAGSYSASDDEGIDTIVTGPGTYYIVVYWGDAGNTYDLWWDDIYLPPLSSDDPYEPNNSAVAAWDFSLGEGTLLSTYGGALGVQWNADWYMIDVTAGYENVVIDATFTDADGDIDIELVDSAGVPVASSTSITDNENINTLVAGPGTYYIRVFGGNAGNTYDLWWDDVEAIPPSVVSTSPVDGATAVPTSATVQVTFSEAMNQAATEAAFSISPAVAGSYSWSGSGDALTFAPVSLLAEGTTYTVTIGAGAADLVGNTLAAYSFSFTTTGGDSTSSCGCSPLQTDTTTLGNVFGAILSWLPLMLLLLFRNRHSQRRATE